MVCPDYPGNPVETAGEMQSHFGGGTPSQPPQRWWRGTNFSATGGRTPCEHCYYFGATQVMDCLIKTTYLLLLSDQQIADFGIVWVGTHDAHKLLAPVSEIWPSTSKEWERSPISRRIFCFLSTAVIVVDAVDVERCPWHHPSSATLLKVAVFVYLRRFLTDQSLHPCSIRRTNSIVCRMDIISTLSRSLHSVFQHLARNCTRLQCSDQMWQTNKTLFQIIWKHWYFRFSKICDCWAYYISSLLSSTQSHTTSDSADVYMRWKPTTWNFQNVTARLEKATLSDGCLFTQRKIRLWTEIIVLYSQSFGPTIIIKK